MIILARLRNYSEPVEVTSIDFKLRTFTWDENVESFDDAEFIIPDNSRITELAVKALEHYAVWIDWEDDSVGDAARKALEEIKRAMQEGKK